MGSGSCQKRSLAARPTFRRGCQAPFSSNVDGGWAGAGQKKVNAGGTEVEYWMDAVFSCLKPVPWFGFCVRAESFESVPPSRTLRVDMCLGLLNLER